MNKQRHSFIFLLPILALSISGCSIFDMANGKSSSSSSEETSTSEDVTLTEASSSSSSSESSSSSSTSASAGGSTSTSSSSGTLTYSALSIHFLELGNANTGDCTYIKAGDNDILIDAGSRKGSAATIESFLEDSSRGDDYVKDGKLEYVIATHAHQDHIAGFVGNTSTSETGGRDGIFYHYKVDNLLDFSYYDDGSNSFPNTLTTLPTAETNITTAIYENYVTARNYAISKGTTWKTAGQVWNSGNEADRTITLGEGISLKLIYNFFYDHTSADVASLESGYTKSDFSNQNDDSVCVLLSQGDKNFLFTGDAEAYAEHSLVKYNTLPEVELFKGGHHGSYTASSNELLAEIKPKMVCICCCAGNQEYASDATHSFPAQEMINRIAPYTSRVYVTTLGSWTSSSYYSSFNGNICVYYSTKGEETLKCSNNNTALKDTDWFKTNRTTPSAWA